MRKFVSLILTLTILTCLSGTSVFASESVSPYKEIFISINEEYDLDLGYSPVDESKLTLDKYEDILREVAIQQRKIMNHIAMRETESAIESLIQPSVSDIVPLAIVTKTRTLDVWGYKTFFKMTATFDVNGTIVSNLRNAKMSTTVWARYKEFLYSGLSSPQYSVVDAGHTGTVSFRGKLWLEGNLIATNVLYYAEFRYNI